MCVHPYTFLRKDLRGDLPKPIWPSGVRLVQFDEKLYARAAHDLLTQAYHRGGGHVGLFDSWLHSLIEDPDLDPSVFFLALADECVIGLALCWTSSFIKDLAVAEQWRRKGLGEALLLQAFNTFRERGAAYVDLKVETDNPFKAERLYARLGMRPVS